MTILSFPDFSDFEFIRIFSYLTMGTLLYKIYMKGKGQWLKHNKGNRWNEMENIILRYQKCDYVL